MGGKRIAEQVRRALIAAAKTSAVVVAIDASGCSDDSPCMAMPEEGGVYRADPCATGGAGGSAGSGGANTGGRRTGGAAGVIDPCPCTGNDCAP